MLTIESVKNLQWDDDAHTMFSCLVKYSEFNEEHPVGVNAIDTYSHIQELWTKGNAGEYGEIAEYVPPVIEEVTVAKDAQPETQGTQPL